MSVFCQECGTSNEDGAINCRVCEQKLTKASKPAAAAMPASAAEKEKTAVSGIKATAGKPSKPYNYVFPSVLVALFCCSPVMGIIGLVFGIMSSSSYKMADYDAAERYSKYAKRCVLWGILIGFVSVIILYIAGFLSE